MLALRRSAVFVMCCRHLDIVVVCWTVGCRKVATPMASWCSRLVIVVVLETGLQLNLHSTTPQNRRWHLVSKTLAKKDPGLTELAPLTAARSNHERIRSSGVSGPHRDLRLRQDYIFSRRHTSWRMMRMSMATAMMMGFHWGRSCRLRTSLERSAHRPRAPFTTCRGLSCLMKIRSAPIH